MGNELIGQSLGQCHILHRETWGISAHAKP